MPISVVMPALEMAQETGKLISWLKKEGEIVAKGEPLLEIETDKAVMEIESPGDGVLGGVKAHAGADIPVGQTIAWILRPGEVAPTEEVRAESGRRHEAASVVPSVRASEVAAASSASAARISPKARRLAKEQGVDLAKVKGSGAGGEILASDILAVAQSREAPSASGVAEPSETLSPIRRLMAERTTQSWTSVPHFFVTRDVDATALNEVKERLAAVAETTGGVRATHTDLLVALVARVLAKHSPLNASWTGKDIRENREINIGLAMAVDEGVVAPVIPGADRAPLAQIAAQRKDLSDRARVGKLRPQDLAGGTFTISNLGMFNVDSFTAIIIAPQAAILAVGCIADRVVAKDGKPVVRPLISLTLSVDHRVADGARAARFLDDLAQAMQHPGEWLELP
ncbi:MAG TPA: dihydrolipoamide acetyltransferase family protein [Terriglobales bacterium]|nr:dihydrolipoamide acetyltransferase family protein [Terriglobales bacterium]